MTTAIETIDVCCSFFVVDEPATDWQDGDLSEIYKGHFCRSGFSYWLFSSSGFRDTTLFVRLLPLDIQNLGSTLSKVNTFFAKTIHFKNAISISNLSTVQMVIFHSNSFRILINIIFDLETILPIIFIFSSELFAGRLRLPFIYFHEISKSKQRIHDPCYGNTEDVNKGVKVIRSASRQSERD